MILYASFSHLFLHAVLVPPFDPKNESEIADLMDWSLTVDSTWALTTSGDDAWIASPLDFVGSKHLGKGEKLVFLRDSDLVDPKRTYIEISQKLTHTLSLHHIPERKAWCKTDDRGDVDEVIKVHDFDATDAGRVVSMDMRALRQYAGLTGQWLFRMFDVPRYRSGSFHGFASEMSRQSIPGGSNLHGWIHVAEKYASVSRGIQWANPGLTKAEIARTVWGSDAATEQYESFIAWDWRNQTVDTFSCDPAELPTISCLRTARFKQALHFSNLECSGSTKPIQKNTRSKGEQFPVAERGTSKVGASMMLVKSMHTCATLASCRTPNSCIGSRLTKNPRQDYRNRS
ncbi:hypothetical protein [Rhodopirellula sp. P2]|uniref:hypothetical protein n=1 Tax=Rhodopirellula sp. P2 TaxID=2127060 RepID=UPI002368B8F7|nr:hypothetical protein [Rhodopirellula sp. P2]WDQ17060.1 hypothetical protein PSR62_00565 [Rhodopirellula sp. P2]